MICNRKSAMCPQPWLEAFCLCLLGVGVFGGCSDAKVPDLGGVHGVVTLDGEPLSGATVTFRLQDGAGRSASGLTDDAGKYRLKYLPGHAGAIPGEYFVSVRKVVVADTGEKDSQGFPVRDVQEVIPQRYATAAGQLTASVSQGDNAIDFALQTVPEH